MNKENITIQDNGESLVDLLGYVPNAILKLYPGGKPYLRKTVAEMLRQANDALPEGYSFLITNAWRSKEQQSKILKMFTDIFSNQHPEWNEKQIAEEVYKYAAPIEGNDASGHLCGASLDISLAKNGRQIPMRSSKLSFQENALSIQLKLPKHIQHNRELLRTALEKAGFSNLNEEWWHFSYGDYEWAKKTGRKTAIYGVKGL